MSITVTAPDSTTHEFPDGTPAPAIRTAMANYVASQGGGPAGTPAPGAPGGHSLGREVALRLLSGLPPAMSVAGGVVGTGAGPVGTVAGASAGMMGGRALENFGRNLMGEPRAQGAADMVASLMGKELPPGLPGQAIDLAGEGLAGAAFEALPFIPQAGAAALRAGKGAIENRAINSALKKVDAISAARDIEAPLNVELAGNAARRAASSSEAKATIKQAAPGNDIKFDDIADHIIDKLEKLHGSTYSKAAAADLRAQVKLRVPEVVSAHTLGAIEPAGAAMGLEHSNIAKQAFQEISKPTYKAAEGGLKLRPKLDTEIASAYKEIIEARAPGVHDINLRTKTALGEKEQLSRMKRTLPSSGKQRVLQARSNALARVRAVQGSGESPLGLSLTHGVVINPSSVAGAAGMGARALSSAPVQNTARFGPRTLQFLDALLRSQQPDTTTAGQ